MTREQGKTRREYLRLAVVGSAAGLAGCSDLESVVGGGDNSSTDDGGSLFGTETATEAETEAGATPTSREAGTETEAPEGGGSGTCTEPSGTPRELLPPDAAPLGRESVRSTDASAEGFQSGVSATYTIDGEEYNVTIERYGSGDQASRRFDRVAGLISSSEDLTAVGASIGRYVVLFGGPPGRERQVRDFAAASGAVGRACATDGLELLVETDRTTDTETATETADGGGSGPCTEPTVPPEEALPPDTEQFTRQSVEDVDASAEGFQSGVAGNYAGPDGGYIMAVERYESESQATQRLRTLETALSQSDQDLTAVGAAVGRYLVFTLSPTGGESQLRGLAASSPVVSQACAADGLELVIEP